VNQCLAQTPTPTTRDIASEVVAEYGSPADAAAYKAMRDNSGLWNYPAAIATIPDGYAIERVGQNWAIGPSDSNTRLIVTDLSQVQFAVTAFDRQIIRAATIGATR
jgi:hypothetical protein